METLTRTQYHDSEVSKKTDFENSAEFPVKLLQAFINESTCDCVHDFIISGFEVVQRAPVEMSVMVKQGFAFNKQYGMALFLVENVVLPVSDSSATQDRIDTIEIRFHEPDRETERRAFKDPANGHESYLEVPTRKEITVEIRCAEGIPGSGVAPPVDSGWIKIAEVNIPSSAIAIHDADIRNADAISDGVQNTGWTADQNSTFRQGSINNLVERLTGHEQENITESNTVHGIHQGHTGGFDADTLDGHEGSEFALESEVSQSIESLNEIIGQRFTPLEATKAYDSTYTYALNEPCFYLGVPYKSLQNNNTNNNPFSATAYWEVTGGGASSLEAGIMFENGGMERNVTGYNTYADTISASPVDGTGGTPTITFTFNSTSPLVGLGDAILTKPATNCQGQGVSHDFTIDRGKVQSAVQVSFEYQTGALYADGDIGVFVYDITNATLIPLSIQSLPASLTPSKYLGTFIPSTSTQYRLILHITSTNANTYTFEIDDIVVSQKQIAIGAAISIWNTFTPVETNKGTAVWSGEWKWRRNGSLLEVYAYIVTQVVGDTTGLYSFSLPEGLKADKLANSYHAQGLWSARSGSIIANWESADGFNFYSLSPSGGNRSIELFPVVGALIIFTFSVPISQWTSNINLASDFTEYAYNTNRSNADDTTSFGYGSEGVLFPNIPLILRYKDVKWRNPRQPTDQVDLQFKDNQGEWQTQKYYHWLNGASGTGVVINDPTLPNPSGLTHYALDAYTERVYIHPYQNGVSGSGWNTGGLGDARWRVRKVSNGNMAEVPPLVVAEYSDTSTVNNGAEAVIPFVTKVTDTHSAFATGTSTFTAPMSGQYQVSFGGSGGSVSTNSGYFQIRTYKNGAIDTKRIITNSFLANITGWDLNGSYTIYLAQGDTLQFKLLSSGNIAGSLAARYVSIIRLGT